jgi:uncharacterized membrane protein YuzA (DUF378 family)
MNLTVASVVILTLVLLILSPILWGIVAVTLDTIRAFFGDRRR